MISKEQFKYFNSLKNKKNRLNEKKILVEGERLVFELLKSNIKLDYLLISDNSSFSKIGNNIIKEAKKNKTQIDTLDHHLIKKLSQTKNNQSFIAICDLPEYKNINYNNNILALDHISDPGNMGTLLRTAEWFGIQNIILSENCVDIFNPKVIRSAMGAHFYLDSILNCNLSNELINLNNNDYSILGADLNGYQISKIKIKKKWVLIVGNEANGLSNTILNQINDFITISKHGNIESLNAAIAGSILLNTLVNK